MLLIKFNGWFQCRLATDPDPADERRGISGMIKVFPGEPDLDRIIRFQPPFLRRSHTPEAGVTISYILNENGIVKDHFLNGGTINLLGEPMFRGDNGIVAEDGKEPIVPFILEIKKGNVCIYRSTSEDAEYNKFPYPALQAQAIVDAPGFMMNATSILHIEKHFESRANKIIEDNKIETDPLQIEINKRRIKFLTSPSASTFFSIYMQYTIPLMGPGNIKDDLNLLGENITLEKEWTVDLWFGAWDPDALCGFTEGFVTIK